MFTTGSSPGNWGNLELNQPGSLLHIYPNFINVIDDDHLSVNWTIPSAPNGVYDLNWLVSFPWCFYCVVSTLPSAFTIYSCTPPPAVITPASSTSFCSPGSVQLNANIGNGLTYQWYRYNIPISLATGSSYIATTSGNYYVIVTDASGCVAISATTAVNVYGVPAATITPSSSLTYCSGVGVDLVANNGTGLTYQWYKNGFSITGETSMTYHAIYPAHYKVKVSNPGGCYKFSSPVVTAIIPAPPAFIIPQGPTTFCLGDSVKLNANTGTSLTYQWSKNNNLISGATANFYTAKKAGAYRVTVTNSSGCTRKSVKVNVNIPCRIGDTINDEISAITIFPDPATDILNFTGPEFNSVKIINSQGKVVAAFNNSDSQVDISKLAPGIYTALIRYNNAVVAKKFVKVSN